MKNYLLIFLIFCCSTNAHAQHITTIVNDTSFINTMLVQHNIYRKEIKVPSLTWSPQLAAASLQWAVYLAKTNKFEHSRELKTIGENIWMGTADAFTQEFMVKDWGNEKADFVYNIFPNCSKSDAEVGHYTQIIWRNTTQVGCAIASNGTNDYLVCRYSPAGNYIGQKPY